MTLAVLFFKNYFLGFFFLIGQIGMKEERAAGQTEPKLLLRTQLQGRPNQSGLECVLDCHSSAFLVTFSFCMLSQPAPSQ